MNANTHSNGMELTDRELQNVVGGTTVLWPPKLPIIIWKPTPTFPVPPPRPGEPVPTPWW